MAYLIQHLYECVERFLIVNEEAEGEIYFCQSLRGTLQSHDPTTIPVVLRKDNSLSPLVSPQRLVVQRSDKELRLTSANRRQPHVFLNIFSVKSEKRLLFIFRELIINYEQER